MKMSTIEKLEHFFKPEVKKAGEDLIKKQVVFVQRSVDTQVDAYVKATTPTRIFFKSSSIESKGFSVDCNCSSSKKGQLCKHIWAVLVLLDKKSSDFLENKESLEKLSREEPTSQSQINYQAKQAEYRKKAYETQKERAKAIKASAKQRASGKSSPDLPEEVLAAMKYFEDNGFPMSPPFTEEMISEAKRSLSKIFHPDKGGSQDEIQQLLEYSSILLNH